MKTFTYMIAQGDMLIRKIDKLPVNVKPMESEAGNFILTHSETGHHHVVKKQEGISFFQNDNDPLVAYLVVDGKKVKSACFVEHLRDHDTHESISLLKMPTGDKITEDKKVYEIRRQREYTAEGFRKARD